MRDQVVDLLEKVDLAMGASAGVIDEHRLAAIASVADLIRTRLAYPEDVVVVGLVGGTGSGKSSLLNAIAGVEAAETGGMRPTTSTPLAIVPAARRGAMAGYLEMIGVEAGDDPSPISWLCLIDLPDTDSVVPDHRHTVDRLLPTLDVVAWVLDPEKYRDASLHAAIAGLADYADQFVFVLNQVDRLVGDEGELLGADLTAALVDDGVDSPVVVLVAAAPTSGPPIGIESLIDDLRTAAGDERAVYSKLLADLHAASSALAGEVDGAGGLDFEARWSAAIDSARASLEAGRASEAAHIISGLLDALAREAGGPTAEEISGRIPAVAAVVTASGLEAARPSGRWWRSRKRPPTGPAPDRVLDQIEAEIGVPVREALAKRAAAASAISDLHLSVMQARGPGSGTRPV